MTTNRNRVCKNIWKSGDRFWVCLGINKRYFWRGPYDLQKDAEAVRDELVKLRHPRPGISINYVSPKSYLPRKPWRLRLGVGDARRSAGYYATWDDAWAEAKKRAGTEPGSVITSSSTPASNTPG